MMSGKFEYKSEFLYLTTIGRSSGQPREIEIWFVPYDGNYYLCAEGRYHADWVQNILHNSTVSFWVEGQTYQGIGHLVDPDLEPGTVAALTAQFDAKYRWSDGLLVELYPIPPAL
jgi:deazaflavin-dependent oxidoreductase (nitroreductase family)